MAMTTKSAPEESTHAPQGPAVIPEKSLWHYLGVSLSAVALVAVVAIAVMSIVVPRAVGGTTLAVLSGSMEPNYPPGTLIVIRPVEPEEISIGDVITYQLESGKPAVATHRVMEIGFRADGERQFITQGDNNPVPDADPVREIQVRGKLWYAIPYLGYVSNFMDQGQRSVLISVVAVGLLVYASWLIMSGVRDRRRPKDDPATTSDSATDASTTRGSTG